MIVAEMCFWLAFSAGRIARLIGRSTQSERGQQQDPWRAMHRQVKPVNRKVHRLPGGDPPDFFPDMWFWEKGRQTQGERGHDKERQALDEH
jgi:hypothetical protein